MQGVFNPNIPIYHPPNSAGGLHFSAFHYASRAISIRDPYICAAHESLPTNQSHAVFHRPVVCMCIENIAFKNSLKAYFNGKKQ